MFKAISEQEFLDRANTPIDYIGIYELALIIDGVVDCEGIIVSFKDKQYLIKSLAIGEDDFEFFYFAFPREYKCRKVLSSPNEPIYFIRKENEKGSFRALRFQIGNRPILATADDDGFLSIGISHWDINDNRIEFENDILLNDN